MGRGQKLLTEMFEKRKLLNYKYDYAIDVMDGNEDVIQLLINKEIIRQNGNQLELDDHFLKFFEEILEVNEEINTAYINENLKQIKDEYMLYYLQSNTDSERFKYLKAVKSALRKISRITLRNIVDLHRNVDNTFKTETNYKIKLSKLENQKFKLQAIQQMIIETENLLNEDELTFFKTATDEELKHIKTDLLLDLTEARQNLIETRRQIIEYINQVKYQSQFLEKLKQVKYLRDQFEIKHRTNIVQVLNEQHLLAYEPKPSYPLKLSLDELQTDEVYTLIEKVSRRYKTNSQRKTQTAADLETEELQNLSEEEQFVDLYALRDEFVRSENHLFNFIQDHVFKTELDFAQKVTLYCQMVAIFDDEFDVKDEYSKSENIEYAIVYPSKK